jgi:probable phosphoglycerate mutase
MKLVLIRHGQTQWNRQNRIHGWLDSQLTDQASVQLFNLHIPHLNNPLLYSSDLGRASTSAYIIANRIGINVIIDKRLRERRFGVLQGKVINQEENLKNYWQQYHLRYVQPLVNIPNVESEHAFSMRINSFLDELYKRDFNRDIIIVSHGEWLRGFTNILHTRPSWCEGNGIQANSKIMVYEINMS